MPNQAYGDLEHMETPYVVKLHRFTPLAPTQAVFTFAHPNSAAPAVDNSRATDLRFERPGAPAAICHGLAGYFDACLCASCFACRHQSSLCSDTVLGSLQCVTLHPGATGSW